MNMKVTQKTVVDEDDQGDIISASIHVIVAARALVARGRSVKATTRVPTFLIGELDEALRHYDDVARSESNRARRGLPPGAPDPDSITGVG